MIPRALVRYQRQWRGRLVIQAHHHTNGPCGLFVFAKIHPAKI